MTSRARKVLDRIVALIVIGGCWSWAILLSQGTQNEVAEALYFLSAMVLVVAFFLFAMAPSSSGDADEVGSDLEELAGNVELLFERHEVARREAQQLRNELEKARTANPSQNQ